MKRSRRICRALPLVAIMAALLLIQSSLSHMQRASAEGPGLHNKTAGPVKRRGSSYHPGATAATGSLMTAGEADEVLTLHNRARAAVGSRSVNWSKKLAACAQEWADHLASERCNLEHRPSSGAWSRGYGENLFACTRGYGNAGAAVSAWVSEKKYYRGGILEDSNWYQSGHYTQVVWKDTRYIGCGKAVCGGNLVVVCNYDPAGNVFGQRPY